MDDTMQIAIVDDDLGMRRALEDLVLSIGYRPRCFASPADFLSAPGRSGFGCIILDIKMPGMSGLDLQRVLNGEAQPPPIIFLSSYADETVRRQAASHGATCVLTKPVDDGSLIACIESAVTKPH
jgi:FixJ family two-component response regulator